MFLKVPDPILSEFYPATHLTLFLSIYEGFGLRWLKVIFWQAMHHISKFSYE